MKTRTLSRAAAFRDLRLDAHYFLSDGHIAAETLESATAKGLSLVQLGEIASDVWSPKRFKRAYAAPGEPSISYLRPYDVFDYFPKSADEISIGRTRGLSDYRVAEGVVLQTCSGRNLGPNAVVDKYLQEFMLSHDMIRIEIESNVMRHFVVSFLRSRLGQQLIRRDKTGSVIDHLSDFHLREQLIPMPEPQHRERIGQTMATAHATRSEARGLIAETLREYARALPTLDSPKRLRSGWNIRSHELSGRLDAAFYDPNVVAVSHDLRAMGGHSLGEIARVEKPSGRYKTNYVESEFGRPMLSGRQLLQYRPVNLKYMPPASLRDPQRYELEEGWIALPADGRAEERLGTPVMVTPARSGWFASGHIARVIPHSGVNRGSVWLALATDHVQMQIAALAAGSVVDATYPEDLESVILPPLNEELGDSMAKAWASFDEADRLEGVATNGIESMLGAFVN